MKIFFCPVLQFTGCDIASERVKTRSLLLETICLSSSLCCLLVRLPMLNPTVCWLVCPSCVHTVCCPSVYNFVWLSAGWSLCLSVGTHIWGRLSFGSLSVDLAVCPSWVWLSAGWSLSILCWHPYWGRLSFGSLSVGSLSILGLIVSAGQSLCPSCVGTHIGAGCLLVHCLLAVCPSWAWLSAGWSLCPSCVGTRIGGGCLLVHCLLAVCPSWVWLSAGWSLCPSCVGNHIGAVFCSTVVCLSILGLPFCLSVYLSINALIFVCHLSSVSLNVCWLVCLCHSSTSLSTLTNPPVFPTALPGPPHLDVRLVCDRFRTWRPASGILRVSYLPCPHQSNHKWTLQTLRLCTHHRQHVAKSATP